MDHWRAVLGGSKALEAEVNLLDVVPAAAGLPKWRLTYQQWPRDVIIRRNMTTSGWLDLLTLLTANEVGIMSETGENVVNATVVEALSNLPDREIMLTCLDFRGTGGVPGKNTNSPEKTICQKCP